MKNLNKLILAGLAVAMITASCSIEKRVHNSGYHITWNKVKQQADGEKTVTASKEVKVATNKSFTNVESVVKSEELKSNSIQANLEVSKIEKIENQLSQTSTLTKQESKVSVYSETSNAFSNKAAQSVKNNDVKSNVIKSAVKKLEKSNKASSQADKELIILLVLWFFLGFFAAHRWYAGKPVGWNILFILTAGGCGVWALVDLVQILTGDF